jgi:predicted nucleic acid-binding protein
LILVDTSAWIELLAQPPRARLTDAQLLSCATCGPVLQEVWQGVRRRQDETQFRARLLALPVLADPVPLALYMAAAELYRLGRDKGFTFGQPPTA